MRTDLYRLYDEAGSPLYIGIAMSWAHRMRTHSREQSWWREVATCQVSRFDSRDEAIKAEARAIQSEMPRYNKALNEYSPTAPLGLRNAPARKRVECPRCKRQLRPNGCGLPAHLDDASKRCEGVRWLTVAERREIGLSA